MPENCRFQMQLIVCDARKLQMSDVVALCVWCQKTADIRCRTLCVWCQKTADVRCRSVLSSGCKFCKRCLCSYNAQCCPKFTAFEHEVHIKKHLLSWTLEFLETWTLDMKPHKQDYCAQHSLVTHSTPQEVTTLLKQPNTCCPFCWLSINSFLLSSYSAVVLS
jgi:hypothetical protein